MAVESYAMTTDDKEVFAEWMMRSGYATGHGETMTDLLEELDWQITEMVQYAASAERERIVAVLESEGWMAAAMLARHKK
jgi:hypothetical protein